MLSGGEIILRLVVATAFGAIIGLNRERVAAAGLRTHALVSLGSALFMVVSIYGFATVLNENVHLDPSRIAASVATGIGFLGAGTIVLRKDLVHGLTTAASIWTVAGIGLAAGAGLFLAAGVSTVLAFVVLALVKPLEYRFERTRRTTLTLVCDAEKFPHDDVYAALAAEGIHVETFDLTCDTEKGRDTIELTLQNAPRDSRELIARMRALPTVKEVRGVVELGPD